MSTPYKTTRRIEFRDTDAAGIAHFSAFFAYMEEAEHELLRSVGLSVMMQDESGTISWPRVSASCDYLGAVKFEDEVEIEVAVQRLGTKSITYEFRFSHGEKEIALGKMTSVCCRLANDAPPRSIAIPNEVAKKLAIFVNE